jgi:IMP dehydrogenase
MAKYVGKGLTYDDVLLIPQLSKVVTRSELNTVANVTRNFCIGTPIISANMDTVTGYNMAEAMDKYNGLGIIHRFMKIHQQVDIVEALKRNWQKLIAAAVGVKDAKTRIPLLVNAGANIICLDIAHAHSVLVDKVLWYINKTYDKNKPFDLIVGNIATKSAAEYFIEKGPYTHLIDSVKVGIGPGSLCSTRIVTGHGVPQLTAIEAVASVAKKYGIPVIADGGIRHSGDIVKALAFGADCTMFGGLFAGCEETPGKVTIVGDKRCKMYRGMASYDAMIDIGREDTTPEGFSALVECKGPVKDIMKDLVGGVKSGLSYAGAKNIEELQETAEYVVVSPATIVENSPHLFHWGKTC